MDLATSGGHSRADVYAAQETDNEREVVSGFGFWMIYNTTVLYFLDDTQRA
jgi:hypothetical protein